MMREINLALVLAFLLRGGEFAMAGTSTTEKFVSDIERAMSFSPGDADVIGPLSEIFKGGKGGLPSDEAVAKLVDALNVGDKEHKLAGEVLAHVDIERASQRSVHGTSAQVSVLSNLIWEKAKELQLTDPVAARKYGRASVFLAAQLEFHGFGSDVLGKVEDEKSFKSITGVTPAQWQSLKKVLDEYQDLVRRRVDRFVAADKLHDAFIQSNGGLDAKEVDRFIEAVSAYRKEFADDLFMQYYGIRSVWRMLNLARIRKDAPATARFREVLEKWKAESKEEPVQRWLDQALTREGGMPSVLIQVRK